MKFVLVLLFLSLVLAVLGIAYLPNEIVQAICILYVILGGIIFLITCAACADASMSSKEE